MTKIDVGLMEICWNYHMHGNYEDKWWKDKPKSNTQTIEIKIKPHKAKNKNMKCAKKKCKIFLIMIK
jgi:hypothetical protein